MASTGAGTRGLDTSARSMSLKMGEPHLLCRERRVEAAHRVSRAAVFASALASPRTPQRADAARSCPRMQARGLARVTGGRHPPRCETRVPPGKRGSHTDFRHTATVLAGRARGSRCPQPGAPAQAHNAPRRLRLSILRRRTSRALDELPRSSCRPAEKQRARRSRAARRRSAASRVRRHLAVLSTVRRPAVRRPRCGGAEVHHASNTPAASCAPSKAAGFRRTLAAPVRRPSREAGASASSARLLACPLPPVQIPTVRRSRRSAAACRPRPASRHPASTAEV